jgi:hypothetical protein
MRCSRCGCKKNNPIEEESFIYYRFKLRFPIYKLRAFTGLTNLAGEETTEIFFRAINRFISVSDQLQAVKTEFRSSSGKPAVVKPRAFVELLDYLKSADEIQKQFNKEQKQMSKFLYLFIIMPLLENVAANTDIEGFRSVLHRHLVGYNLKIENNLINFFFGIMGESVEDTREIVKLLADNLSKLVIILNGYLDITEWKIEQHSWEEAKEKLKLTIDAPYYAYAEATGYTYDLLSGEWDLDPTFVTLF